MRGQYGNNNPTEPTSNVPGVVSIFAVLGGFLIARRLLTSPHWLGR